ncbi:LytTR family DNA-binding domain-containing protein [uncultured Croceitalea sp.]|uniref:LytR/AlgR family response regulator transcription factor n=1 Tax=uncultured Croceitalea sp. TaxID=1798908 RepID=UPI003305E8F5
MNKINCFIIEDDPIILNWMINTVETKFPKLSICGSANDVDEAVLKINQVQTDLLLSDVDLISGSVFDVLEQTKFNEFHTILITSYEGFAVDAFKVKAFDFMVKPVTVEALGACLQHFFDFWNEKKQMEMVLPLLNIKTGSKRIAFYHKGYTELMNIEDIIYFEADENYCIVHLSGNRKITVSKTLKSYAEKLEHNIHFLRIHQSYLINEKHINKIIMTKLPQVLMSNGKHLNVSRSKKAEFIDKVLN